MKILYSPFLIMFLAKIWRENPLFTFFNNAFMFGIHVEFEVKIV